MQGGKILKNNKAFSLIEVLVATTVLSLLALAVATITTDMFKASKSNQQNYEATSMVNSINAILTSQANCSQNFVGRSLNSSTQTGDIVSPNGAGGWVTAFDVNSGQAYFNNSITIDSWSLDQQLIVSTAPIYRVVSQLNLNLSKVGDTVIGGRQIRRSVALLVDLTGAGGTVTSCSALGSPTLNSVGTVSCPAGEVVTSVVNGLAVCEPVSGAGPDFSPLSSGGVSWNSFALSNTGGGTIGGYYSCGPITTVTLTDAAVLSTSKAAFISFVIEDSWHESPSLRIYNMSNQLVGQVGQTGRGGDGKSFGMGGDVTVPLNNKQFKMQLCRDAHGGTARYAVKAVIN